MRLKWPVVLTGAGLGVLVAVWFATSPSIDPLPWEPAAAPPLAGPLAPNRALEEIEWLGERLAGPEDVALDVRGRIYCGLSDGTVRRLDPSGASGKFEIFASTGGRPQGLAFDASGRLWVADTTRGLLSIDPDGRVVFETTADVAFANDVAVGPDGRVWVTESSTRFGPDELLLDALEARPHGRLIEFDPATGRSRVALEGLYFANGVALPADGRFVVVAESFRYRIRRLWLAGPDAGRDDVFVDGLAGFPDGIASDGAGTFWVALYGPRSRALDATLHPRPWLKRWVARLPRALQSGGRPYGLVLAINEEGRVLSSLHDRDGETISHITSVEPHGDDLYLGTVVGSRIGRHPLR
jgi:sugar lactone lactonase YvrE